jgi:hypothetical protein
MKDVGRSEQNAIFDKEGEREREREYLDDSLL